VIFDCAHFKHVERLISTHVNSVSVCLVSYLIFAVISPSPPLAVLPTASACPLLLI